MKTTAKLEQSDVERALSAGLGEAVRNGWTVSVAVVDAGGHLLGFMRCDGAIPASVEVALAKARTAATFNVSTGVLEDRIAERPGMMMLPGATALRGGLPLVAGGSPVGGVGVSGGTPQQDEQIAKAAADALG